MQVAEMANEKEYQHIQSDIRDQAVRAMKNGEAGRANHNIHRVTAIDDPSTDESAPAVAKVDTRLRPGSREIERPSIKFFPTDQLPNFEDHVLDDRVGWSSSPFVNQLEIECERPEENVKSTKDMWVFDPSVEQLFGDMLDLDALGADISQARNIPKGDLRSGAKNGVNTVREQKLHVVGEKSQLIESAKDIIRPIVGAEAEQVPFHTKTPMEIYYYVDDVIEGAENIGNDKMNRLLGEVKQLREDVREVNNDRQHTEETSIQVFDEVLSHEGYEYPSTVSEPRDAITKHDVGTLNYLDI